MYGMVSKCEDSDENTNLKNNHICKEPYDIYKIRDDRANGMALLTQGS